MDHMSNPDISSIEGNTDMRHLTKPRGKGYSFRMVTPGILFGTKNPWTGKPFGKEIKLGLGTKVHAEALRQRDVCLGQVRQLEDEARRAKGHGGAGRVFDLSHDSALEWQDLRATTDDLDGVDHVLTNELDRAARAGHEEEVERFAAVVFRGAVAVSKAVQLYLEERSEANPYGFDPLARTTALNVQSTIKHLIAFLGGDEPTLQDVTPKKAFDFRMNYLPLVVGLQPATVNKHMTLLKGLWAWAITDKRYLQSRNGKPIRNPWEAEAAGTPKKKAAKRDEGREAFSKDEVGNLLKGFPAWGSRQGDIMRLALATGCRADEIGALMLQYVRPDGSGFDIPTGKTSRFIPVVEECQKLLAQRVAIVTESQKETPEHERRLFPDWPLKPSTGKANSVSQWFTRYRREVLGKESDGRLALHSFRHTWRTTARRAGVAEDRIRELGGWQGKQDAADVYDHGLEERHLREGQAAIWGEFRGQGYLDKF